MPTVIPKYDDTPKPTPEVTETDKPVPEYKREKKKLPPVEHVENTVQFGSQLIEIKPTRLKYQRDRTAAFYRMLDAYNLVDILALRDGTLDPERSSDKMLFDWLIAVTDDPELVRNEYDDVTSETVYQCLQLFKKLNRIKDEDEKKDQAQMENR